MRYYSAKTEGIWSGEIGSRDATLNEGEPHANKICGAVPAAISLELNTRVRHFCYNRGGNNKDLAESSACFFTGNLYSREVILQKQRELCAVASLTVLNRRNEVRAHIHAALNGALAPRR